MCSHSHNDFSLAGCVHTRGYVRIKQGLLYNAPVCRLRSDGFLPILSPCLNYENPWYKEDGGSRRSPIVACWLRDPFLTRSPEGQVCHTTGTCWIPCHKSQAQ